MGFIGKSPNVNRLRLNPRSSDPVSPTDGDLQYADGSARAEGLWVYKNSAWIQVGSEGGAKNYVTNGDFEAGSTTGWSLSHSTIDATTKVPNQASGAWTAAAGTLSIAAVNATPLADTYSLALVSSGATTAGDMLVSNTFTIDREQLAKPMRFSFYYEAASGSSNITWSGTTSNSFSVQIYDVDNAVWIQPAGTFSMIQGSLAGYATGTFQTSSNGNEYRIAISFANATAGAVTLWIDDVVVSPEVAPLGAVASDWQAYTPTGSWSANTTYTGFWRRTGDKLELDIKVATSGAPTSAALTVNLPSGITIDAAKLTDVTAGVAAIEGSVAIRDAGTENYTGMLRYNSTSSIAVFKDDGDGTVSAVTQAAPMTWASGDFLTIKATGIPVAGWSSNVTVSNNTDTRIVAARVSGDPASATSNNPIIFPTADYDTHAAYNTTTGRYTVPVSGIYRIYASINMGTVGATTGLFIWKNGVQDTRIGSLESGIDTAYVGAIQVNAGDVLDIRTQTNSDVGSLSYLYFERLSGPSVVAATETIVMRTGGDPASASSGNPVIVPTIAYDTHGAYNASTGRYTAPVSGFYRVHGSIVSANTAVGVSAYVNAASIILLGTTDSNGEGTYTGTVRANAGDIIDVRPNNTLDATSMTLHVERIG